MACFTRESPIGRWLVNTAFVLYYTVAPPGVVDTGAKPVAPELHCVFASSCNSEFVPKWLDQ